jgi:hypothetical protein
MTVSSRECFSLFLASKDTLWISWHDSIIYRSEKKGIAPLVDYLTEHQPSEEDVVIYDRVVGNAAAVLIGKLPCKLVYTDIVSEIALKTMNAAGIDCYHKDVVPHIINRTGDGRCPFEKASIGKSADEFLEFLRTSHPPGMGMPA